MLHNRFVKTLFKNVEVPRNKIVTDEIVCQALLGTDSELRTFPKYVYTALG